MLQVTSAIAVCAALVVSMRASRRTAVVVTLAVTLLSLASTAEHVALGRTGGSGFTLIEMAALPGLLVLVVRFATVRVAAAIGALASLAFAALMLRFFAPSTVLEAVGACAFFCVPALMAAGTGLYLRVLDDRHERMLVEVRRGQRLQVARDLHDFVAHDVSGVVVLAQAARAVADEAPREVIRSLERIETAGLHAMSSIDRALDVLHESETAGARSEALHANGDGIAAIREIVERFATTPGTDVQLDLGDRLGGLSPETSDTARRIVAEALTNVHRHAPDADQVTVRVARTGHALALRIHDSGANSSPHRGAGSPTRRGGFGLVALRERVEALGGQLAYGVDGEGGWSVTGNVPLRQDPAR